VVRDEEQQRVERFARELDWSSLTQELAPRKVYPVATEAVSTHLHGSLRSWTGGILARVCTAFCDRRFSEDESRFQVLMREIQAARRLDTIGASTGRLDI
jgi:hypothetical protein